MCVEQPWLEGAISSIVHLSVEVVRTAEFEGNVSGRNTIGRFWFICFYSLLSTLPDTPYLNINKARGSPKENSMVEFIKRFVKEDDGLEMVEWAVVGSSIVVIAALAFAPLGTAVSGVMGTIAGYVQ